MAEEFIDVLDENGKKTGVRKTRTEVHAKGLWHGAVHVWIYNSKGEILLQRRSMQKDSWPGRWDISVAGHISAGETPERAALKEVSEEIGVKLSAKDLKQVMIRKSSSLPKAGFFNNEFDYVYLCEMDKLPENLQKEEVEAVEFVPAFQRWRYREPWERATGLVDLGLAAPIGVGFVGNARLIVGR